MKKQNMRTIKRRRRERKTDYRARVILLESNLSRIVIRKTNKYIITQYVKSKESQDHVLITVNSKELLKYGWEKEKAGSLKSIPAAYLTGLLLGEKIKKTEKKNNKVILDLGLIRNIKKNRIYAVLKGLIDAGLDIDHKKDIFPDGKRIKGEHMKNKIDFDSIKSKLLKTSLIKNDKIK
jgi:large subunit ribosomal protein L18